MPRGPRTTPRPGSPRAAGAPRPRPSRPRAARRRGARPGATPRRRPVLRGPSRSAAENPRRRAASEFAVGRGLPRRWRPSFGAGRRGRIPAWSLCVGRFGGSARGLGPTSFRRARALGGALLTPGADAVLTFRALRCLSVRVVELNRRGGLWGLVAQPPVEPVAGLASWRLVCSTREAVTRLLRRGGEALRNGAKLLSQMILGPISAARATSSFPTTPKSKGIQQTPTAHIA